MNTARPAATVMVCRQGQNGPEVVMVKRSRKVGFFPSAWVFPGGRVDESDGSFPTVGSCAGLSDVAFAVAAIRECFEEAGFWLGVGDPSEELRAALNAREVTLPADGSLVANLDRIRQWSWWITPDTEPRRYDTRFFLCCIGDNEAQNASQDDYETVDLCWVEPAVAVRQHEAGEMFMAPPTYITLLELAAFSHVDEIWRAASEQVILPIQPIHNKTDEGLEIWLPTHPQHPEQKPDLGGQKIVLQERTWSLH